jgi:asparagine synthase (glutamine-hydrolysing)
MCGFTVYASVGSKQEQLEASLARIAHRGPDARSTREWQFEDGLHAGLGHVRLSIIDTSSAGEQPMISSNGKIAMVFNGEIFNHKALRAHMPEHSFVGHSDSEAVLEYYQRTGVDGLRNVRGMFTIAFLHLDSGRLVVARDPIGVKPVYYARSADGFAFSSEIRGLAPFLTEAPSVSRDALFDFLNCGFVYEPHTGLDGIAKVPAGCYVEIEGQSMSVKRFFSLEKSTRSGEFHDAAVGDAIASQLEADVKLGVFFSGGLDSSVIAAYARKDSLFAANDAVELKSSGMVDDEPYARAIAEHLDMNFVTVQLPSTANDPEAFLRSVQAVAEGTEELVSDFTYIASQALAHAARASGYKVMLSGMGGDELFIGYPRYQLLLRGKAFGAISALLRLPGISALVRSRPAFAKKVDRFIAYFDEKQFPLAYARLLGYLNGDEVRQLWHGADHDEVAARFVRRCNDMLAGFEGASDLVKAMVLDYYGFLSHNLSVADKSSMSASLELRVPLLDQDLYCSYLGAVRNGHEAPRFGKVRLRELLYRMVPKSLVERPKTGFNPPLDSKIAGLGEERIVKELRAGALGEHVELAAAERIVRAHFAGASNNTYKIWQLLYLTYWLRDKTVAGTTTAHSN